MNNILSAIIDFLSSGIKRSLLLIGIIVVIAFVEFVSLGLARRTFVFYTISDGVINVEDRMIKRASSREENIIRYTEEVLLGPVAQDLLPLFPRETRLNTLMLRGGIVYINFSADAALPPIEGGQTKANFNTLYRGIKRNFSYVKDVRFFIEGKSVYREELGV